MYQNAYDFSCWYGKRSNQILGGVRKEMKGSGVGADKIINWCNN